MKTHTIDWKYVKEGFDEETGELLPAGLEIVSTVICNTQKHQVPAFISSGWLKKQINENT